VRRRSLGSGSDRSAPAVDGPARYPDGRDGNTVLGAEADTPSRTRRQTTAERQGYTPALWPSLAARKSTTAEKSEVTCMGWEQNLTLEQNLGAKTAAIGDPPV